MFDNFSHPPGRSFPLPSGFGVFVFLFPNSNHFSQAYIITYTLLIHVYMCGVCIGIGPMLLRLLPVPLMT